MRRRNPAALPEGGLFSGRYQIVRCMKAGGMGAVYECVHLTTRKRRALKVMLPQMLESPGMRERFELEARVTAEIQSDHIVETFDAGVDDATGAPFLVMELLRGDDLDSLLEGRGPFSHADVVLLLAQAALALDQTHAAGIVHRDLKPQNLFLTTCDDGSPRLKILDFGIAKVIADGKTTGQQTAAIGTPVYMAPEQATGEGRIGPAADLYALGHIAYTLLSGSAYWKEEHLSLPVYAFLGSMIEGPKEPPTARAARSGVALPAAFDAWFARATATSPSARFDRASTQVAELATALGTPPPRTLLGAPPPLSRGVSVPRAADSAQEHVGASSQPRTNEPSAGSMGALLRDRAPAPTASSRVLLAALVLAAGAVGLFAVARVVGGAGRPAPTPAAIATASPAATTMAAPVPSAAAESSVAAPEATTASPSATAPTVVPGAPASVKPPAHARSRAPSLPDRGCDPPFEVDGAGHRHMKPQCL
jgi:serine/threonine-protein kinase